MRKSVLLVGWLAMLSVVSIEGGIWYHHHVRSNRLQAWSNNIHVDKIPTLSPRGAKSVQNLPDKNLILALSPSGYSISYAETNGKLFVGDMASPADVEELSFAGSISNIKWIDNQSLLLVTASETSYSKNFVLYRYDFANHQRRLIYPFTGFQKDDFIQSIGFTVATNDTYIVIGNGQKNIVYQFNTNGILFQADLGGLVPVQICMGETNRNVYFQDIHNMLYVKSEENGSIHLIAKDAVLIRNIGNDIYYGILKNGSIVSVCKYENDSSSIVESLPKPISKSNLYVDHNGMVFTWNKQELRNEKHVWKVPSGFQMRMGDGGLFIASAKEIKMVVY